MAVSFVKFQNTVRITITAPETDEVPPVYDEDGNMVTPAHGTQIEVLDPPLASRLFAESHMPKVGDTIIFDAPGTPAEYVDSRRVQGRDMPKTTGIPPVQAQPVTYVFAVANGPSSWLVTAVGQDDSVTILRGDT